MRNKVLRIQISSRGGGVEIALSGKYKGHKMTAYQNYLGGGMLGGIANDCTIRDWRDDPVLVKKAEQLRKFFAKQMDISYDEHKDRPVSAY